VLRIGSVASAVVQGRSKTTEDESRNAVDRNRRPFPITADLQARNYAPVQPWDARQLARKRPASRGPTDHPGAPQPATNYGLYNYVFPIFWCQTRA